jgi:hypothetical protein
MNQKNTKKSNLYEYLIIFLIYFENIIKYYFNYKSNKNRLIAKKYPILHNGLIIDEEYGNDNVDFVFDKYGRIVNQYYVKSKDKLD